MIIAALEALPDADLGDDAEYHYYCCRADLAICGEELDPAEAEDEEGSQSDPDLCEKCRWVAASPRRRGCGAQFCRLRSWWRRWHS